MRAAVLKAKQKLVVEEVPDLSPGQGEVLIRVIYCGICGSDLHLFNDDRTPKGIIAGHEWVGTVAEAGPGVTGWKPGDRVVMNGYPAGRGPTREEAVEAWLTDPVRGLMLHPAITAGGYAEYLLWDANVLARVPDNVTDENAALTDTLNVGLGAVRASEIRIGDSVAIIGAGPIGLCALLGAKLAGAGNVYISDLAESRRNIALELGADEAFDPGKGDVRAQIIAKTNGGAAIVLDCVGSPSTIQQSVDMVREGGMVILVGLTTKPVEIQPLVWFAKSVRYQTKLSGSVPVILSLLSQKKIDTRPLVTDKVPLANIQEAFESLQVPDSRLKILVYP